MILDCFISSFYFFRGDRVEIDNFYNNEIRSSKYLPQIEEVVVEYNWIFKEDNY